MPWIMVEDLLHREGPTSPSRGNTFGRPHVANRPGPSYIDARPPTMTRITKQAHGGWINLRGYAMKMKILLGFALTGLLGAGFAQAACIYPKAPASIPDGATATEQEMLDGMKAVKEYNSQVTAYLSCLDMEVAARIDSAGADAPADQVAQIRAIAAKRHNAAVEELEAHAARFNEQVKTFKARSKG